MKLTTKTSKGLVVGVFFLAGCNRDVEPLDRLSHAYTAFVDNALNAEAASYVPTISDADHPSQYWNSLGAALNLASTNASRALAASDCIAAYDGRVTQMMDLFYEENDKVDKSVLELIESGNAIHDRELRTDSLAIAKSAREAQIDLASMHQLLAKRFELQIKIMKGLVANSGDVVALFKADPKSSQESSQEIAQIGKDIETRRTSLNTSKQNARDTFSALKGKTGLKEYPPENGK